MGLGQFGDRRYAQALDSLRDEIREDLTEGIEINKIVPQLIMQLH